MTQAAQTPETKPQTDEEIIDSIGAYGYGWHDSDAAGASARRGLNEPSDGDQHRAQGAQEDGDVKPHGQGTVEWLELYSAFRSVVALGFRVQLSRARSREAKLRQLFPEPPPRSQEAGTAGVGQGVRCVRSGGSHRWEFYRRS